MNALRARITNTLVLAAGDALVDREELPEDAIWKYLSRHQDDERFWRLLDDLEESIVHNYHLTYNRATQRYVPE